MPLLNHYGAKIIAGGAAFLLGILTVFFWFVPDHRKNPSFQSTNQFAHQHLSVSEYETGQELKALAYTLNANDNLERIAVLRYEHRYYDLVIKLANRIEDADLVPAGTRLKLPNLLDLLTEEGFTKAAVAETELILCSRAKFLRVRRQLASHRQNAGGNRVSVPEEIRLILLEAAADLETAIKGLRIGRPGVGQIPKSLIGQLEANAGSLRELAAGANDGYGYDLDEVEQRYALGLAYAIIWAREGFK
jgi:hypothetical protein